MVAVYAPPTHIPNHVIHYNQLTRNITLSEIVKFMISWDSKA